MFLRNDSIACRITYTGLTGELYLNQPFAQQRKVQLDLYHNRSMGSLTDALEALLEDMTMSEP